MIISPLVVYTKVSPNKSARKAKIDTITIHHMACNPTIETQGDNFAVSSRQASSNYGIGSDGRIACYAPEEYRSWCSNSRANDDRAITIEVANDGREPDWHISDAAITSLIKLCADICQRNDIKELKWQDNKSLVGQIDKQNVTIHKWFANTACPGPYIKSKTTYICECVNALLKGQDKQVVSPSKSTKTNEELAVEVIRGLWGVYPERKKLLEEAGYNYSEVQKIVNQLMNGKYNVYFD